MAIRRSIKSLPIPACLALAALGLTQPAHALYGVPNLYVSMDLCQGCSSDDQIFADYLDFTALSNALTMSHTIVGQIYGQDFASAIATANYGSLHALAQASRAPGVTLGPGDTGTAIAVASAGWEDWLQPSTQPTSTNLSYHYHLVADGNRTPHASAKISLEVHGPFGVGLLLDDSRDSSVFPVGTDLDLSGVFTVPAAYATGKYQIIAVLETEASASVCGTVCGSSYVAQADYSHTMRMEIDSLTPGGNTVAASGYNLATPLPVPEPPSWCLMLAGGLGLSAVTRAKRRTSGDARSRRP